MKKIFLIILIGFLLTMFFLGWGIIFCPVEIVAIHVTPHSRDILVKNFPLTAYGRVLWWEGSKAMLKEKYNLPDVDFHGMQSINFWDFGKGYQIEERDSESFFPGRDMSYLLCFDDMKTKENCIRKKSLMRIGITRDGVVLLYSGGKEYKETKNGEVIRVKN